SWVPRILNKDKVGDTLVQRGVDGESSYYQDINRVLPGYIVKVRGTSFSRDRFWDPENIPDVRLKTDNDYLEAFREHLNAAIKARLRSSGPRCAPIPAGLDSPSSAVIAADILGAAGKK